MLKPIFVGQRFGRWEVTGEGHMKSQHYHYPCRCDCGKQRVVLVPSCAAIARVRRWLVRAVHWIAGMLELARWILNENLSSPAD